MVISSDDSLQPREFPFPPAQFEGSLNTELDLPKLCMKLTYIHPTLQPFYILLLSLGGDQRISLGKNAVIYLFVFIEGRGVHLGFIVLVLGL